MEPATSCRTRYEDALRATAAEPSTAGPSRSSLAPSATSTRSSISSSTVHVNAFDAAGVGSADNVIDVGGGSRLVDALLIRGFADVTVLDISAAGLRTAQHRLGTDADRVDWVVTDLLTWQPARTYRVWHDQAVFHFLTTAEARARYGGALREATDTGSVAVLGCFAPRRSAVLLGPAGDPLRRTRSGRGTRCAVGARGAGAGRTPHPGRRAAAVHLGGVSPAVLNPATPTAPGPRRRGARPSAEDGQCGRSRVSCARWKSKCSVG